jgi:hypothetical protein
MIIDLRDKKSYEMGHFPNAVNIERDAILNTTKFDLPEKVYVYCYKGQCAEAVAEHLNKHGINATNVGGYDTTDILTFVRTQQKIKGINKYGDLNINSRPIHCSDLKREVIYIKDKDVWEKENNDRDKLKLAIKTITSKNIKQIPVWQKENPDCFDSSSRKNDQYLKIVSNAMNGLTKEETDKNYDKIIAKLAKETVIQKNLI